MSGSAKIGETAIVWAVTYQPPSVSVSRTIKRTADYVPGGDGDNQTVRPQGKEKHAHATDSCRPIHGCSGGQVETAVAGNRDPCHARVAVVGGGWEGC